MSAWEKYDTVPTLGLQSLLDNQQLWHNQRNHIHWGENKIQEEIKRSRLALITKSSIKNINKDNFWDAPAFLFSVKAGYTSSLWLQPFPVVSVSVGEGIWGNKKRTTITHDDDVSVRDGNFSLIFLFFFLIITPTWVVASASKALLSFVIWRWGFNKGKKTQCGRHHRSAAAAENAFLSTLTLNRVSRFGWGGGCCCITPPAMPCENTHRGMLSSQCFYYISLTV